MATLINNQIGSALSWAGINLLLDSEEYQAWVEALVPLGDLNAILDGRGYWGGPLLAGVTSSVRGRPKPPPRLNQFYYPCGAGSWAEGYFLLDEVGYQQYLASYASGAFAAPFVMMDGSGQGITTNLYALSARPLNKVQVAVDAEGDLPPGFYLLHLVDERYWWQFQDVAVQPLTSTTWAGMYTALAGLLGITLTNDTIPSAYLQPCLDCALDAQSSNAAVILDAVASNCGQTIVRAYDGTYTASSNSTHNTTFAANLLDFPSWMAGGDLFASGSAALNALLPASVVVAFPKFSQGVAVNCRSNRYPFGLQAGDFYTVSTAISAVSGYSGLTGKGTKYFHDTAAALFTLPTDSTPTNNTTLQALALQIAQDYYDGLFGGDDRVYGSIVEWQPEGFHDLLFTYSKTRFSTRVRRMPFNLHCEELNHGAGLHDNPAGLNATFTSPVVTSVSCSGGTLTVVTKNFTETFACGRSTAWSIT